MKCIYCGCMDSKVVDSRSSEDGSSIRRRRECMQCGKRFTTYETIETAMKAGANVLVAGSYVFNGDLESNVHKIQKRMQEISEKID